MTRCGAVLADMQRASEGGARARAFDVILGEVDR